jgi:putative peptide maturation system protein
LLWEREAYDGSFHYDLLLRACPGGTVSLSFCPDRTLPWPLRGVHRWNERDLLRVNSTVMNVDQAVACLDFIWDEAPVTRRLVHMCLIHEALRKGPAEVSDAELQAAMDAFRRRHKLHRAADTQRWMRQRGIAQDQLEDYLADEVKVAQLRARVTADRVEDYFRSHHADFDTVRIARFECRDAEDARRTAEDVRGGGVTFYQAAERQFLAAAAEGRAQHKPTFAVLQRREVAPEFAACLFSAGPGEVVGPVRLGDSFVVLRVLSMTPAALDTPMREAIQDILFEAWLEERREAATVEWFWGSTGRTSQVA